MKKIVATSLFALCLSTVLSPIAANAKNKIGILIVGDSWADLQCRFGAFKDELKYEKLSEVELFGCKNTTEWGLKTYHLLEKKWSERILAQLQNPLIHIVYVSIGGNDFSKYWNKSMSDEQEAKLFNQFRTNVQKALNYIFEERPDVKVLVNGYDYPNFKRFIQIQPYREKFERMGKPDVATLNQALLRMAKEMSKVADYDPRVSYIHHYGLMHYYFGLNDGTVGKRQTLPPTLISPNYDIIAYGGKIDYATPTHALLRISPLALDAIHLDNKGYRLVIRHSLRNRIIPWIRAMTSDPTAASAAHD